MFRHHSHRNRSTNKSLLEGAPANKSRLSFPNLSYCWHVGAAFLCGFALACAVFFIADYHQEAIIIFNDRMTEKANLPPSSPSSSQSSTQVEAGM